MSYNINKNDKKYSQDRVRMRWGYLIPSLVPNLGIYFMTPALGKTVAKGGSVT